MGWAECGTVVISPDSRLVPGLKEEYYQLRGWNTSSGLPTSATLKRLGLDDVADDLKVSGLLG